MNLLASMMSILIALAIMSGLTLLLTTFLVVANKKFHVEEDRRIDFVENMLPGNNCGACGLPGCRAFAEALVQQKASPVQCTVSSDEIKTRIAQLIGVEVGIQEKQVARLACAGGDNVAHRQAYYSGLKSCRAATLIAGGDKSCGWGCLGFGDCEKACDFAAIYMNPHGLPIVIDDKCTACGDCVDICPKELFSLHSISHRLWVACKNQQAGDEILSHCEVACTACGRCASDSPNLITMKHNLAVIDYTAFNVHSEYKTITMPIQRCPTGAIVYLEANGIVIKGAAAAKILRKEALQVAPT